MVGWIGAERAIHRAPTTYRWSLADYPDLHPEGVTIQSRTGITIAGRFFPGRSRTTIILSHGYGDNQERMLPWANFLHQAGYSVVTYDMRNRGASGGDAITVGALEQQDLLLVIDAVAARPDVDRDKIGALGVSLGGATTILTAAQDQRIKAVVDDCGFTDVTGVLGTAFEYFLHLPPFPFAPVAVKIAELRTGQQVAKVRPIDVVGRISPRPIFIILGLADPAVPPVNSARMYAAEGEPKQVWFVPGAKHNGSREVAGAEYEQRIVAFFCQSLGE
ncbi:MAG TPA: alpha/beta hydrolase [Nitrolancea sp.]|nr:alpha/beta hydrolase [Nitrolancea sp.]